MNRPNIIFSKSPFYFLKLPADPSALWLEGIQMQHCLATDHTSYAHRMALGEIELYSMVEGEVNQAGELISHWPVVDIEVAITKSSYCAEVLTEPYVTQVRGPRNLCPPHDKYIPALIEFFQECGKKWRLTGHDIPNFDQKLDGHLLVERAHQLKSGRNLNS